MPNDQNLPIAPNDDPTSEPEMPGTPGPTVPDPDPQPPGDPNPYPVTDPIPGQPTPQPISDPPLEPTDPGALPNIFRSAYERRSRQIH